jgi:hypothetical protein
MKLVAVLPDQKIALVDEATLSNVTWGKKEPYFFKTKKITAEAFFKNIPN